MPVRLRQEVSADSAHSAFQKADSKPFGGGQESLALRRTTPRLDFVQQGRHAVQWVGHKDEELSRSSSMRRFQWLSLIAVWTGAAVSGAALIAGELDENKVRATVLQRF